MLLPDAASLDRLADHGWPALEREQLEGWTLRASSGVTNRANSVLTSGAVDDLDSAVDAAERWYAARSLPPVFQVSPASSPALTDVLRGRGYRDHSPTDILVADRAAAAVPAVDPAVRITDCPDEAWLDTWWSVDGRGGAAERDVAARILRGGPALYAAHGDLAAPDPVARLALVGEWGGLYAVATRPEARRRGLARALVQALSTASAEHGVSGLWLQVLADNAAAHALYASLGFRPVSHYSYWF
ncbi:GNAT family N-acetyltransferase [Leifsonia sp. 1010]|uniref:GNAT family N-acetyltransferase n=1 Tax=Leifsonia sp. 1010 TaxID=2817769 RepID=UPI002858D36F|nr:GNAT family N-acetyltransferase [Leifsonia sp. 1010]MDR6611029.1 GNAT superfamily N-acetyltransferase [Leifsonia sp. 1010]